MVRSIFDVVHEFSALLPTTVVGTMLGIPPERHDEARRWTNQPVRHREPGNPVPPPAAAEGAMNMAVLAHQLTQAPRATGRRHPQRAG